VDSDLITFIFLKNFSGCSQPTFFDKERDDDKLSLLGSGNKKKLDLTGSNCKINTISSWYMDCNGNKDTVESMENTFDIEEDPRNNELEVKTSKMCGKSRSF